jgi:hypothetical protein
MTATTTPGTARPAIPPEPQPVVVASGIEKSFFTAGCGRFRPAVRFPECADLMLQAGEIVGLVGENGSGQSTLMKILVGPLAADARPVAVTDQLGYSPQEPLGYGRLTCDEHFELFRHATACRTPLSGRADRRSTSPSGSPLRPDASQVETGSQFPKPDRALSLSRPPRSSRFG